MITADHDLGYVRSGPAAWHPRVVHHLMGSESGDENVDQFPCNEFKATIKTPQCLDP